MNRASHRHGNPFRDLAVSLGVVLMLGSGVAVDGKPLGKATVTQVNNDVRCQPSRGAERPAKPQDVVRGADVLRTGQKSQAELEFDDRTITRLGSNSIFTFDPDKRHFNLQSGVLLFDMPKDAGGGRIRTAAITAAIEGTSGMVVRRGEPQVICLVGKIRILDNDDRPLALLEPGDTFLNGQVFQIDLQGLRSGKLLQRGLPHNRLAFQTALHRQQTRIQTGRLVLATAKERLPGLQRLPLQGQLPLVQPRVDLRLQQPPSLVNPSSQPAPSTGIDTSLVQGIEQHRERNIKNRLRQDTLRELLLQRQPPLPPIR